MAPRTVSRETDSGVVDRAAPGPRHGLGRFGWLRGRPVSLLGFQRSQRPAGCAGLLGAGSAARPGRDLGLREPRNRGSVPSRGGYPPARLAPVGLHVPVAVGGSPGAVLV